MLKLIKNGERKGTRKTGNKEKADFNTDISKTKEIQILLPIILEINERRSPNINDGEMFPKN